jgi:hypothetical protein
MYYTHWTLKPLRHWLQNIRHSSYIFLHIINANLHNSRQRYNWQLRWTVKADAMSHMGKVAKPLCWHFQVLPRQTQQNTIYGTQPRKCPHATEQTLPQFTLSTVRTLLLHCWRHTPVGQHHNKLTTVPRVMGLSQALVGRPCDTPHTWNQLRGLTVQRNVSTERVSCVLLNWNELLIASTLNAK